MATEMMTKPSGLLCLSASCGQVGRRESSSGQSREARATTDGAWGGRYEQAEDTA